MGHKRVNKLEKNCETCGSVFIVWPSRSAVKYCSSECRNVGRSVKNKNRKIKIRGKSETIMCPICNNYFTIPSNQKGKRKYCSVGCRVKAQTNGSFHPCPNCGKDVWQRASEKRDRRNIYCSASCRSTFTKTGVPRPDSSIRMSGKNNPMYGKSPVHPNPIIYTDIYGRKLTLKSSYELRFVKVLESVGLEFYYEPVRFEVDKGTYKPDFFIPKFGSYIEVKGWIRDVHHELVSEFITKYGDIKLVGKYELELAEEDFDSFVYYTGLGGCSAKIPSLETRRVSLKQVAIL